MDDIFLNRRSVRRYKDTPVDEEMLLQICEAARMSPSWGNLQCGELIIMKNDETKAFLASMLSAKNPATKAITAAPVVIGVCGAPAKSGFYKGQQSTRYKHWFLYDLGIISQTICLKAWELGLGTVIVGSFQHDKVEEYLKVPEGLELVALIPLGYPDHNPPAPKRKDLEEFIHQESF